MRLPEQGKAASEALKRCVKRLHDQGVTYYSIRLAAMGLVEALYDKERAEQKRLVAEMQAKQKLRQEQEQEEQEEQERQQLRAKREQGDGRSRR